MILKIMIVMKYKKYLFILIGIILGYSLNSFINLEEESDKHYSDNNPAHSEEMEDGNYKVILSSKAAERLDVQTLSVEKTQWTIPYSAIVYDVYGKTWVYEEIEPFTYIRRQINISGVIDSLATLSKPLKYDMTIATVGVPELYGVEDGIGEDGVGY